MATTEEIELKKKLVKIQTDVEYYLRYFPETRNSDRLLTIKIRAKYVPTLSFSDVLRLPTQESIKRIRAKYNQNGFFLPTDMNVRKKRASNSKAIKHYLETFEATGEIVAGSYERLQQK